MPSRRERPRIRESSRDEEPYVIIIHDIPRNCRWQELKDMTRSMGGEHSLKAEVFDVGNGTHMGHCTIKGRSDAMRVYDNLCHRGWDGHRVRIQLSAHEKSGTLRTIEGPKETRGTVEPVGPRPVLQQAPPIAATTSHSMPPSIYATAAQPSASMPYSPIYPPSSVWPAPPSIPSVTAARMSMGSYPVVTSQPYLASTMHAQPVPTMMEYVTYQPTKSVSTSSPRASLPLRPLENTTTILICGLPHDHSEKELRARLNHYGHVVYLEIHPDSRRPGKNRGTARVRYSTSFAASTAVRQLDGEYLRDRKISVKLDRDSQAVASRPPLCETKNGSSHNSSSRQKKSNMVSGPTTKSRWSTTQNRPATPGSRKSMGGGPLVVNGAKKSLTRRNSGGALSDDNSDSSSSSEDEDSDKNSDSEDEHHGVRIVHDSRCQHKR